jgi:hypothetical protein
VNPTLTDAQFSETSWHDVHIHGYAVVPDTYELLFDVDYISEWLCDPETRLASFRLSPATLRFLNCVHIDFDVRSDKGLLTILEIQRDDWSRHPAAQLGTWRWTIVCPSGRIQFRSSGYQLFLRAEPVLSSEQYLGAKSRGRPTFVGEVPPP